MQCLSKKASGIASSIKVAEACCGINSQDLKESYSSFWARIDGFNDSGLLKEYKPMGGLTRTWTVRGTMHTFPSKDYYTHVFGSGRDRILGRYDNWAKRIGAPSHDVRIESLYLPLMDDIKGKSVTSCYIEEFITDRLAKLGIKNKAQLRRGWSSQATHGPLWVGLTEMSYLGLLVSAGRSGSQGLWMRTSDWLTIGRKVPDTNDCITQLVRKYIEQYGPVYLSDIAYWNNRLFANELKQSIKTLEKDLVKESIEGSTENFYSIEGEKDFVDPPRVIILPEFDSLTMGYRDRSRFMSQDILKYVSKPQGIISRTILVDGFIAATWGRKRCRDGIEVSVLPIRELDTMEKRLIEEKFAEYSDYLRCSVHVKF